MATIESKHQTTRTASVETFSSDNNKTKYKATEVTILEQ